MGLNLGTYNIRDGQGFGLSQEIRAIERGNYNVMLLTDTNIPDAVFCHNFLEYDVVSSKETVTMSEGTQVGGRDRIVGESLGVDC